MITNIKDNALFEATTIALGNNNHKVIGDLYQDFYIDNEKELIATGTYVIREYRVNVDNTIDFTDYHIDPTTVVKVVSCDFADKSDITYSDGDYLC